MFLLLKTKAFKWKRNSGEVQTYGRLKVKLLYHVNVLNIEKEK